MSTMTSAMNGVKLNAAPRARVQARASVVTQAAIGHKNPYAGAPATPRSVRWRRLHARRAGGRCRRSIRGIWCPDSSPVCRPAGPPLASQMS